MSRKPQLLYLGFAFPPGVASFYPEAQPAGHLIETGLVNCLRPWFDIRSVGISWLNVTEVPPGGSSPGLPHQLNLLDRRPEMLHRLCSLLRLKKRYDAWVKSGWRPDLLLMCNFSPVYNGFVRWLKRQPDAPPLAVYLADSMNLQRPFSRAKRLRHRFKPLVWSDSEMVNYIDACIAVSKSTEQFFAQRKLPWFWMPSGCDHKRALACRDETEPSTGGPIQFGYFGTLSPHGGLPSLLDVFCSSTHDSALHICGFGKGKDAILARCNADSRLRYYPPRSPDECLLLAQQCDVMVNPRPVFPGNENNFPSKVFEYALSGCAILSSRVSCVEEVLGPSASYFDEGNFETSLHAKLRELAETPRAELHRRGRAIQERVLAEFSWETTAEHLASFLTRVAESGRSRVF